MDNNKKLLQILDTESIIPVFQPIFSLTDGKIFSYEALSRISDRNLKMNIEDLFTTADYADKAWELEKLCREKAIDAFHKATTCEKLFLNINPNIIYDENFKNGFTKHCSDLLSFNTNRITFEITERSATIDSNAFYEAINHYKAQGYDIALDDVGSGYSGLNTLVDLKPQFIKIDMHLVRNLDKDITKRLLCKALADFCKNAEIKTIAEGIETEEELSELIKIGIDFGQGFFLGVPRSEIILSNEKTQTLIKNINRKCYIEKTKTSLYPIIKHLCKSSIIFSSTEYCEVIFQELEANPTITEFIIIENEQIVGFMTRIEFMLFMSGRFGFNLNARKKIKDIVDKEFLMVNANLSVDQVSRLAMQRPFDQLYNPIVVEEQNKFYGIVTIKNLLDECTKIEIDVALQANPLSGLPGNRLIEKEIISKVLNDVDYYISYYDIDNFKAYNDAYGFENGDLMLKILAETLQKCARNNEFIGHVGGDDFIVIANYSDGHSFCQEVISMFESQILTLYREDDIKNKYIVSKNRNGVTELFPLASLSIAAVSNKNNKFNDLNEFSNVVATLKKQSKQILGSNICST
ncbi:MAG: GGDEF domain-containing protein [Lachnospiraceae bacterium]